jgi:chromosome partitioning protein
MGEVWGIVNRKGGVAKTTTATTLSYLLAKKGYRVALIDFDGQRHSTIMSRVMEPEKLPVTIYEILKSIVLEEELPGRESYVITTEGGVDLIPANNKLDNFEKLMSDATFAEYKLKEYVDTIRERYDYILIDCMPKMGTPMINVMICCDGLIIPVQSEPLAVEGMGEFLRAYHKIRTNVNTKLEIIGILITMDSKQTIVSKRVKEQLYQVLGEHVRIFQNCIPRSTRVPAVANLGMNICECEPDNPAARAYQKLVEELIDNECKITQDA